MAQAVQREMPDFSRWKTIYPNYIDKRKTREEGRRIALSKAVETPSVVEMAECCSHLKIQVVLEDKQYSRDWLVRGRLRVNFKRPDGTWVNPEVQNKDELMAKMGEMIPRLKSRANGPPPPPFPVEASGASKGGPSGSGQKPPAKKSGKKKK